MTEGRRTWDKLNIAKDEQLLVVYLFKEIFVHHKHASVSEMKDIEYDGLNIVLVTKVEGFVNYNLHKLMRGFCGAKEIIVPESFLKLRLIMMRVIGALWPESLYEAESKEGMQRWHEHRARRLTGSNNADASVSPREAQSLHVERRK